MKKLFALTLACLMLLSFASCGGNGGGGDDSTSGSETDAPNIPECDYTYEIREEIIVVHETEDGRKSTKVLRYPELSGMENEEIQSDVNAIMRDMAERMFILSVPDVDIYIIEDTLFNYEVSSCEVTYLSNSFISVKSSVYSMTSVSSYPDCPVYTVNIDLERAEIIDESDVFADFNEITSRFLSGDFTMVYGMEGLLSETSYKDMILQYKSDYASYPDIYFTPDALVICIDLVPALESSAGFAIPLSEVNDLLAVSPLK